MLSHVGLLGELDFSELFSLGHHVLVLDAHNTTTPVSSQGLVLIELSAEVLGEGLKVLEVLLADLSQGNDGGSLLVDELAEACLTLDEGVGDTLLSAESGQEDEELNGVNVVGHDDKLGLALLNELGDVVETVLEDNGLGALLLRITTSLLDLSLLLKAVLLLLLGLRLVLGQKLKKLACYLSIINKYRRKERTSAAGERNTYPGSCRWSSGTGSEREGPSVSGGGFSFDAGDGCTWAT